MLFGKADGHKEILVCVTSADSATPTHVYACIKDTIVLATVLASTVVSLLQPSVITHIAELSVCTVEQQMLKILGDR